MLRRAAENDVEMIVSFESLVMDEKLYGKPLDYTAAKREIEANEYWMRLNKGQLVATGSLRQRNAGSIYLSNIAVHPGARRNGIARAMICHLLSLCRTAPSIDLAVHPDNQAARALYASLGFRPTQIRENFFGDGEPRLIMLLDLANKAAD
jgi:ribosomal protein S18 acetylase RimI-like enzyme